ncbi:MAG: hypothetical protein AAFR58_07640, partial [Cyanobacteria bacterium J06627_28]
ICMFGTYQSSDIRIELSASAEQIQASLTQPQLLKQWLWPQTIQIEKSTETQLSVGQHFDSKLGLIKTHHSVERLSDEGIRFLLSGSIDGFHEWQWGEGWVQSRLEGISLLPLNIGQTASLFRLKQYLQSRE